MVFWFTKCAKLGSLIGNNLVHLWTRSRNDTFRPYLGANSGSRLGRIVVHVLSFSLGKRKDNAFWGRSQLDDISVHELIII